MPIYKDKEQFYDVVGTVFARLLADPAARDSLRQTGLVVRLDIRQPDAQFTINMLTTPPSFTLGPDGDAVDITLQMSADTLHRVWMDELRLRDAFMQGQVKVEGNVMRALSLGDLFRQAEALYPAVFRERGVGSRE